MYGGVVYGGVCVWECVYVYGCVCMGVCVYGGVCVWRCVYVYGCVCMGVCVYGCVCMRVYGYGSVYMCVCVCVYICGQGLILGPQNLLTHLILTDVDEGGRVPSIFRFKDRNRRHREVKSLAPSHTVSPGRPPPRCGSGI